MLRLIKGSIVPRYMIFTEADAIQYDNKFRKIKVYGPNTETPLYSLRGRRGRDRMVVGFTCAIRAYHH